MPDAAEAVQTNAPSGRGRIAGNVLASSLGQALTMALAIGTTFVTARWLGPEGRGILSLVVTGSTVLAIVLGLGIHQSLSTFVARSEITIRRGVMIAVVVALFTGVVAAVVLAALEPDPARYSALAGWLVPAGGLVVSFGLSQIAIANGLGRVDLGVLNSAATALLLLLGYSVGWYVTADSGGAVVLALVIWLCAQLAGTLVGWFVLWGKRPREIRESVHLGSFISFSLTAYPAALVGQLNARADILVLGALSTTAAVGVYSTSVVAAGVLFVIPAALGSSLARPLGEGHGDTRRLARLSVMGAALSAAVLAVPVVVLLALITDVLLGEGFRQVPLLVAILAPGMILFATAYPASMYYSTSLKRPSLNTFIALVALVVDLGLLVTFGRGRGALGAAAASSVGYAVAGLTNIWLLSRMAKPARPLTMATVGAELSEAMTLALSSVRRMLRR